MNANSSARLSVSSVKEAPKKYGESMNTSVSASACAGSSGVAAAEQAKQRQRGAVRDGRVQQPELPELEARDLPEAGEERW